MSAGDEQVAIPINLNGIHMHIINSLRRQIFADSVSNIKIVPAFPFKDNVSRGTDFLDMIADHPCVCFSSRDNAAHVDNFVFKRDQQCVPVGKNQQFVFISSVSVFCCDFTGNRIGGIHLIKPVVRTCKTVRQLSIRLDFKVAGVGGHFSKKDRRSVIVKDGNVRSTAPVVNEDQSRIGIILHKNFYMRIIGWNRNTIGKNIGGGRRSELYRLCANE